MKVSRTGCRGARVHPRHEHARDVHDHAHELVKTDAKVVKEYETKRNHVKEINVREVDDLVF